MTGFYILMTLIVLGWLSTYGAGIAYLKSLRGDIKKKISDVSVLTTSILFGSLISLFLYALFEEIRLEDLTKKHRYLIVSVGLLIIHVLIILLLFYFKVVTLDFLQ